MTYKQERELNMFLATQKHLVIDPPFKNVPAAFVITRDELDGKITDIQHISKLQGVVITGISGDKNAQKETAVTMLGNIASIIYAWSSKPLNLTIRNQVSYSVSDFKRMKDTPFITVATNILGLATANATILVDFGLTSEQLPEFKQIIEQFETTKDLPRNAVVNKSASREALALLFKETKILLKTRLDRMMLPIKLIDANEYAKYIGCRNTVGNPRTVTQLKGKVTTADNTKGIKNVLVTMVNPVSHETTSKSGVFSFKGITAGSYAITLSADGHKDLSITDIEVKQGKLNMQKIIMEKL